MSSAATVDPGKKAALMLRDKLGADKVILPEDAPPNLGKYGTEFYFVAQATEVVPACRVLPSNSADIVEVLRIVRETRTTFAVKSGGHSMYASGSNAEQGVTIDLGRLKDINISDDRKSVTVGAGCRFGELYQKLESHGLGCVGGRASSVGVSGLIMGGGISFLSMERGLACDNVISYEIVLANGQVLNVTKDSHPDLFWGMRGAGFTFGVVTRFELKTFDFGEVWAGASVFAHEHETAIFEAFDKFVHASPDPLAAAFLVISDGEKDGNSLFTPVMFHSKPQLETTAFNDFKRLTPLVSTAHTRTLVSLCDEIDSQNPSGFRYRSASLSVKCHLPTLKKIATIHAESVALLKDCAGFGPSILYQPLPAAMLPKDDVGNAMGIEPEDTPLIVVALLWRWTETQHDKLINQVADQFVDRVKKTAEADGTFHRYQYLNYADSHQDVYGGYGEKNRKRLLEVAAKYDPEGLMSTLRPGIFLLAGPQEK